MAGMDDTGDALGRADQPAEVARKAAAGGVPAPAVGAADVAGAVGDRDAQQQLDRVTEELRASLERQRARIAGESPGGGQPRRRSNSPAGVRGGGRQVSFLSAGGGAGSIPESMRRSVC